MNCGVPRAYFQRPGLTETLGAKLLGERGFGLPLFDIGKQRACILTVLKLAVLFNFHWSATAFEEKLGVRKFCFV